MQAGLKYKRASRVTKSRVTAGGDIELPIATRGMGLLFKHMLGSTGVPTVIASTTAYRTVHIPVGKLGLGLTIQVGRPEAATGLVRPFTFRGCKITEWEFSLSDNDVANLKLSVDAMDESTVTALAAASY
ncbi:phage tail tube protein [Nonomuraea roseola]|uniref:phage tail tube protein n=1 Tax=Nonomuraea roseola TaxID=46179 RepID=UPI0031F9225F